MLDGIEFKDLPVVIPARLVKLFATVFIDLVAVFWQFFLFGAIFVITEIGIVLVTGNNPPHVSQEFIFLCVAIALFISRPIERWIRADFAKAKAEDERRNAILEEDHRLNRPHSS